MRGSLLHTPLVSLLPPLHHPLPAAAQATGASPELFANLCPEVTGMLACLRLPSTSALDIYAVQQRSHDLTSNFIPVSLGTHTAPRGPQIPQNPSPSTPKHVWVQPTNHKHRGWGEMLLPPRSHARLL